MDGALDGVIAPSRKQITGVDDNGAFDGGGIDKLPIWTLDLQTTAVVLEKQSDGSVVLAKLAISTGRPCSMS